MNMYLFHFHAPGSDFYKLLPLEKAVDKMKKNLTNCLDVLSKNIYQDIYDDLIIGKDIMMEEVIPDNETEKIMQFMHGYLMKKLEMMLETPERCPVFQIHYECETYETIVSFENNIASV